MRRRRRIGNLRHIENDEEAALYIVRFGDKSSLACYNHVLLTRRTNAWISLVIAVSSAVATPPYICIVRKFEVWFWLIALVLQEMWSCKHTFPFSADSAFKKVTSAKVRRWHDRCSPCLPNDLQLSLWRSRSGWTVGRTRCPNWILQT